MTGKRMDEQTIKVGHKETKSIMTKSKGEQDNET